MDKDRIIHGERLLEVIRSEIKHALEVERIEASEEMEFYLVNLLGDYHTASEVHILEEETPLGIIFLEAMSKSPSARAIELKRIGDGTLIGLGFFPEVVRQGIVDKGYYMTIGGLAYDYLAEMPALDSQLVDVYAELSTNFKDLIDVLARIAPWNRAHSDRELMKIYRRWQESGDERLADLLEKAGISTESN